MRGYRDRLIGGAPLLLWLLLCCALLLSVTSANAQPVATSPNSSTDWKARYYSLAQKILSLEKAWGKHKLDYSKARELVTSLQVSLTASQTEVASSIASSVRLQTRLDTILEQIQEVEKTAKAQVLTARIVAGVAIVLGILAAILF